MVISIILFLFYQFDIFIIFLFQFILVVICSSFSIFFAESLDNCFAAFFFSRNGTPLQYSCLENPMDGGAW